MEEHCPTERTMFWLFEDKSHHIFYVEMQRRTKINNEYANTKLEAEKDGKKIVRLRIRLHCRLAHSFFSGKNLFPYLMADHVW